MSFFKTSYATLQAIAQTRRYEDVAGYLVLARHASGLPVAGYEPYKLSGAGVNSIHNKAGVSEETARGVIEHLQELGVIRPTSAETKKISFHARWEMMQGPLDLELPHALIDPPKDLSADSALRRLKKHRIAAPGYAETLTKVSDTELRLDGLMLLLAVYRHTSMQSFGGLRPNCIRRKWEVKSQTPKLGGFRWGAEPDHKNVSAAYIWFMEECLAHAMGGSQGSKKGKKPDLTEEIKTRFWNAWHTLREVGLVYEAVALYDTTPDNENARLWLTLRVNDFHAGSATKTGDPSLLRSLEMTSGTRFMFYTPAVNDREEPESMWVVLPDKRGALVGIWRPRFRAKTRDVGLWIEAEEDAISTTIAAIAQAADEAAT